MRAELKAQRYAVEDEGGVKGDAELRERSMRAVDAIEGFLAEVVRARGGGVR